MRTAFRARRAAVIAALVAISPARAGPGNEAFLPPALSLQRIATVFSPAVANIAFAKQELALELTPSSDQAALSPVLFHHRLWGATATLRLLHAFNAGTGRGFFFEPKLSAAFQQGFQPVTAAPGLLRPSTTELVAGLDVGYRFAFGPIQLTPLFEANAGYCFGCGYLADSSRFRLGASSQFRANRVAIDFRADFLRLRFHW